MSGVITINLCSNESEATRLKSLKIEEAIKESPWFWPGCVDTETIEVLKVLKGFVSDKKMLMIYISSEGDIAGFKKAIEDHFKDYKLIVMPLEGIEKSTTQEWAKQIGAEMFDLKCIIF